MLSLSTSLENYKVPPTMNNGNNIESVLHESRRIAPLEDFQQNAHINSLESYENLYKRSLEEPEAFWKEMALKHLSWFKEPNTVMEAHLDRIGSSSEPYLQWFSDGKINACHNCVDRHVHAGNGERVAIRWQGEDQNEKRTLTYQELLTHTERFASALKQQGVKKGNTVTIYMPMVPELPIAVLACARIGAIHSVVFSAFSAEALASRMEDCNSKFVVTADVSFHAGKTSALKSKVDEAITKLGRSVKTFVYKRGDGTCNMTEGQDFWWHDLVEAAEPSCPAEELAAETPLFILYTSGSTGKPKGVLHTTAGYLLYTTLTTKLVFDLKPSDVFWCTADVGWITGHSYLIYGPLSNGAECLMFEGTPTYPTPDRFWSLVDEYNVSVFYTAPTAIRALMRLGDKWPNKHDLSSLRLLGTVGEPINPEAWLWYYRTIGKERCPIVDTWWQTETGGIMITTLPGAMEMKPGAAGKPFFGIDAQVLTANGKHATQDEGGKLVVASPWPSMIRGVYGDTHAELVKKVYFSDFDQIYFSGDGCRIDEDGYFWLLGRMDDVINVSGHRLATAEIESALVSHEAVSEAAVVGAPHEIKGQGIYCFVTLQAGMDESTALRDEIVAHVRKEISPIATPDTIHFASALPKTRSGKIMRRILRKLAAGEHAALGDITTLADPEIVDALLESKPA